MIIIEHTLVWEGTDSNMTRHMFAGASSPVGFVDFFEHIMPLEKARKRYFLKGSSGSGKSTFIKKTATVFEAEGYDIEKFHCANDPDSLDAISVNSLGLCIIDATSPHSHDPEIPAAIDIIIDFADFLDEGKIIGQIDEIKTLLRAKKTLAEKSRGYFSALGNIYLAEKTACEAALKMDCLNKEVQEYLNTLDVQNAQNQYGCNRKLFLSALAPNGFVSFVDDFFNDCEVYGICSYEGIGADIFLSKLRDELNLRGTDTESFHCPFAPERLEYLHVPETKTAFVITGGRFGYKGNVDKKIDINSCIDVKIQSHAGSGIGKLYSDLFDKMLNDAVDSLKAAKDLHIRIEEIYAEAMDFEKVCEMTEKMIRGMLST